MFLPCLIHLFIYFFVFTVGFSLGQILWMFAMPCWEGWGLIIGVIDKGDDKSYMSYMFFTLSSVQCLTRGPMLYGYLLYLLWLMIGIILVWDFLRVNEFQKGENSLKMKQKGLRPSVITAMNLELRLRLTGKSIKTC